MAEGTKFVKRIIDSVVTCYENSTFEKMMSGCFSFLRKKAKGSCIIDFYVNKFSAGELWRKSKAAFVIRSPFALCRKFFHKNEERIENIKNKSTVYEFMKNAGNISAGDYGHIFMALGAGMLLGTILLSKWQSIENTLLTNLMIISGFVLSFFKSSVKSLAVNSNILKLLKKTVSYYDNNNNQIIDTIHIKRLRIVRWIAVVLGFAVFATEPLSAFIALIAIAVVLWIMWQPQIGVYLFVPFSAILPTMALVGIILITFVSFVLHLMFSKEAEYVSTPFQPWIALFLGISAFAAFTSVSMVSSVKILLIYIVFTMAYLLIVNTIKNRSQWTFLVVLFVIAAAAVALYGIYQNFFLASTTQSWVDEEMFTSIKKRVYGTLDNPNVLGQYFIMMIPLAFALLIKMKGKWQKLLYTACNLAMFVCLMYTWSRGAWIGVIIGILFFVILRDRRWLIICVAGLLIMPSVLPVSVIERFTSIGNLKDSSTAYRVAVWMGSLRLLQDYWFSGIGIGPDAFLEIYPQYALGGAGFALHSHNFYLQWMVDMGIMGLVTYAGIILTGFKRILNLKEKNSVIKTVLIAMTGAMFGYLFHGLAENLWYNYRMILVFWIYFGILESGVSIADDMSFRKDVLQ